MRNVIIINFFVIVIAIGKMSMVTIPEPQMVTVQNVEVITYTRGDTGIEGDILINGRVIPVIFNAAPKMGAAEITESGTLVQNGTVYTFNQIANCTAEGCTTY